MDKQALAAGLLGLAALLILNGLAYTYFWYWQYRWADVPMHLLGGITIASLVAAFGWRRRVSLTTIVGVVLLCGIGWELFEFKFNHFLPATIALKALPAWQRGVADTVSDVAFDLLGALAASYYFLYGRAKQDQT